MKNLLKKLSIGSNQGDDSEGSTSSRSPKQNAGFAPEPQHHSEHNKPFTALTGWLQSVTNRKSPSPPSPSNAKRQVRVDQSDSASSGAFELASDVARHDSESSNLKDRDMDEQYQIQLAMEMSAREDPEAVQIEAVKQMSLGSCPHENSPAEVVAYRYWNYNALSYDDKILDGFYDLYGVPTESTSSKMPSLIDLQAKPVSEGISWEAILVNRAADANLLKLEERAMVLASKSMSDPLLYTESGLVRALAILVSDYMGGPVADPDTMLRAWKSLSYSLKSTLKSMVLPLGSLTIGLARHRALLFKVLADKLGIPCRLVKGRQYTGFDDVAMNFVKIDDGREFIVDLMAAPGTMIPSDAAGTYVDNSEFISSPIAVSKDTDSSNIGSCSSGPLGLFDELSECETAEWRSRLKKWPAGAEDPVSEPAVSAISLRRGTESEDPQTSSDDKRNTCKLEKLRVQDLPSRAHYTFSHARTPSWTEGVSSPAVQKMKVKDVSQYMIDAAKENPHLAQKLHDVLLESGVVAPPNLFTGIYAEHADASTTKSKPQIEHKEETRKMHVTGPHKGQDYSERSQFLPPLPQHGPPRVAPILQLENPKPIEGGLNNVLAQCGLSGHAPSQSDMAPMKFGKNVPVAAAAAAAAAVVASSMVVAATKSSPDPKFELPVAAAATATAAAVVATTAAVGKQYERLDSSPHSPSDGAACFNQVDGSWSGDADDASREPSGSGNKMNDASGITSEGERVSDRSAGTDSAKSDVQLDDVADCEISWDEITLGERIGLGSYGEVYRGDWHGTEVAVKKFLDQDISGESLEEFKSEVRIMKRLRHPNIVLFMGAVTRPPNLCIVTEFLPRGSLYRLLHRPNNQLDERRRLKMALDMARGMNYLHNCSPVIVHRDLKSPNLLVDRNWIVKVCDFGLSRMKHSTFLSSRSTAGTAEWMAPELLRNEPSNEKCDVYSFGVILWELCTLQQPWEGMNPMQVVGAVGFQHRRLDIPDYIDPAIAEIILKCWHTDPKLRPTFAEIMAALKPLQKPVQVPRPRLSRSGDHGQV